MRCVLRFFLFIVDGKLAISAPRTPARGLRNSCSLATILLSPRSLNGSLPLPHFPVSLPVVFFPRRFVTDRTPPHPPALAQFLFCPSLLCLSIYHPLCLCLRPLLSSLSWSFGSSPRFCPFQSDCSVPLQIWRSRSWGWVGREPSPTQYPSPSWNLGSVGDKQKKKKDHPKKGFLVVCFQGGDIPEM